MSGGVGVEKLRFGVIHRKVGPTISVSLVDPVCFVSLVRLETNFALPGNSFRLFIDFHINNGTKIYIKLIPLTFILSPVVGGEGRVRGDVLK
jgi:hypothetical protein